MTSYLTDDFFRMAIRVSDYERGRGDAPRQDRSEIRMASLVLAGQAYIQGKKIIKDLAR